MTHLSIPPLTVDVVEGDITAQHVDAIVNAANSALWMGSGVAGAIKARGGAEIEREARAQGPILPGQAVITGAGRLPARHVIHAAAMGPDLVTSEALIRQATVSALDLAASRQLQSIAMPALGTGVGGFPLSACARVMLEAVLAHAATPTTIRTVRFVLYGRDAAAAFESVIAAPPS
jgi:O-acetyl-ADP-ribose deacetylase (regulator of RNase III)